MIDGAQRNCVKALGTLEFIDNPPERAALLALSQDLAKLVTRMTKKTVGKYSNEDEESADSPELSPEDELS